MPDYTPPEVAAVTGLVDTYLRWRNENEPPRGFERYHPSAFGRCLRLMQYERYAERGYIPWPKDEKKPKLLRIFGNGHSMHDRWRAYFEEIGVLRGYWTCKNPLCAAVTEPGVADPEALLKYKDGEWHRKPRSYGREHLQGCFKPERCVCGSAHFHYDEIDVKSEELNFYGHCDMILDFSKFDHSKFESVKQSYLPEYLPKKPIVVDMKTINMFSFKDVADGKDEHKDYLIQLTIYANVLDCEFGILVYENKNTQETHAVKVDRNADTWFEDVKRQAAIMNSMVEVVDDNGAVHHLLPPPRPLAQDEDACTWCLFKQTCFKSGAWEDPELKEKRKEFYGDLL